MKKRMSALLSCLLLSGMLGSGVSQMERAAAAGAPPANMSVLFKGKTLEFNQEPVLIQDRLLVPAETLAKEIGASVTYDQTSRSLKLVKGHNTFLLPIGGKSATLNGITMALDVPAALINQKLYVPIRFISENLGIEIGYDRDTRTVSLKANAAPSLTILAPSQGDILYSDKVKVSVASFQHELADFRQHMQPEKGQGHIHLWLDTDPSNPKLAHKMINGDPAVFENVQPGRHTLTVQLVGNDHKPIEPAVKQVITFTTAKAPSLTLKGPKEGETIYGDKVTVSSELAGFKLSDFRTESTVAAEEGHLHLWLDTDVSNPKLAFKQINKEPVTYENVKPGNHTLTVQVVGADHKPIEPAVKKVVHFKTAIQPPQKSTEKTVAKPKASAKTYTVNIESFAFKPGSLNVEVGSAVTFKNLDDVDHTVTAKDGTFDSGSIGKGKTYTMTFEKPGQYNIYCKPHNFMVGVINVK